MFQVSHESTILTPAANGLAELVQGIKSGATIVAGQGGGASVSFRRTGRQFLICQTSGSTGTAKIIRRTPESWIRSFEVNQRIFALDRNERYATLGQLGHSLTLYASMEALHVGADLAALSAASPRNMARQIADLRISVVYATPSQLRLLVSGAAAADKPGTSGPRLILSGGGKLDEGTRQALQALFPDAQVREFFGAAETSFVSITDAGSPPGSVGRPYPGVSLRILTDDRLPAQDYGELSVKSPYLFDGYGPDAETGDRVDGTYFAMGELGYVDDLGNLFLRGRKDRMVTVMDRNVFPDEIEQTLLAVPGIRQCTVLAVADEKRGHAIVCVLEAQKDAELEQCLRDLCRTRLGAHAVPRKFLFVDHIPMLAAGKPDLTRVSRLLDGLG